MFHFFVSVPRTLMWWQEMGEKFYNNRGQTYMHTNIRVEYSASFWSRLKSPIFSSDWTGRNYDKTFFSTCIMNVNFESTAIAFVFSIFSYKYPRESRRLENRIHWLISLEIELVRSNLILNHCSSKQNVLFIKQS